MELCRLLQLVLGCAVHCERQAEFIEAIQQMEEDVQRGIMAAIQELPGIDELAGGSLVPNADSLALMTGRSPSQAAGTGFQHLIAQLEACNEEKKQLTKERHQLNLQVSDSCNLTPYTCFYTVFLKRYLPCKMRSSIFKQRWNRCGRVAPHSRAWTARTRRP